MTSFVRLIIVLGVFAASMQPASVAAQTCIGDCNGDGHVTVDEIVVGVNIALGTSSIGNCAALDGDFSGSATVDELVTAVNNALNGCPPTCDLTGLWEVVVTELTPPEPPEVADVEFVQDSLGGVTLVGLAAFHAQVRGDSLGVDYCDCDPEELLCTAGTLAIATGCDAFSGVVDWSEYGTAAACVLEDDNSIVDTGRQSIEASRHPPGAR